SCACVAADLAPSSAGTGPRSPARPDPTRPDLAQWVQIPRSRRSPMSPTPQSQLTDVTRTVSPAPQGHVVSLAQTFAVHPEELWSALTIGSHLEVWFGRARGDVVTGGGCELPDMETAGEVLAAEEPRRLLLTWEFGRSSNELELLVDPVEPEHPEAASDAASGADAAAQPVAAASELATRLTLRHTVPADA